MILTVYIGGFLGQKIRLLLTGPVPQDPELARHVVVKEVDIDGTVLTVFIGRGEQAAGLGIALGPDFIGNGQRIQVNNSDVVAGVGSELAYAGDAYIGAAIVDGGGAGAHGGICGIVRIVFQQQSMEGPGGKGAVLLRMDGVEVAALGGEIGGSGAVSIRHKGYGASGVAGIRQGNGVQYGTRLGVQGQKLGIACGITGLSVVGSNQKVVVTHIGTRPVETAGGGVAPGGELPLCGFCGILVGNRQADIVGASGLTVPEAGVEIAFVVNEGAVGLAAHGILVEPQGLQGHGVKGLDAAIGQTHEDHARRIGGGIDGKAGIVIHLSCGYHLAAGPVQLIEVLSGVDIEIAVHQNGAAAGLAGIALAQLGGPIEDGVFCRGGGGNIHNAVVVFVGTEAGPLGGKVLQIGVLLGLGQSDLDGGGRFRSNITLLLLAHVAGVGDGVGVAVAGEQKEAAVRLRSDAFTGLVIGEENVGFLRADLEGYGHGGQLPDMDGVLGRQGIFIPVMNLNDNVLLAQAGVQIQGQLGQILHPGAIHNGPIAAGMGGRGGFGDKGGIKGKLLRTALDLYPIFPGVPVEFRNVAVTIEQGQSLAALGQGQGFEGKLTRQQQTVILEIGDTGLLAGQPQGNFIGIAAVDKRIGAEGVFTGIRKFSWRIQDLSVLVRVEGMYYIQGGNGIAVVGGRDRQEGRAAVIGKGDRIAVTGGVKSRRDFIMFAAAAAGGVGLQRVQTVVDLGSGDLHRQTIFGGEGGRGMEILIQGRLIGVAFPGNQPVCVAGDRRNHAARCIFHLGGDTGGQGKGHIHGLGLFHLDGIGPALAVFMGDGNGEILGRDRGIGAAVIGYGITLGAEGVGLYGKSVGQGGDGVAGGNGIKVQGQGRAAVQDPELGQGGDPGHFHGVGLDHGIAAAVCEPGLQGEAPARHGFIQQGNEVRFVAFPAFPVILRFRVAVIHAVQARITAVQSGRGGGGVGAQLGVEIGGGAAVLDEIAAVFPFIGGAVAAGGPQELHGAEPVSLGQGAGDGIVAGDGDGTLQPVVTAVGGQKGIGPGQDLGGACDGCGIAVGIRQKNFGGAGQIEGQGVSGTCLGCVKIGHGLPQAGQ